jgi:hypothetical protein
MTDKLDLDFWLQENTRYSDSNMRSHGKHFGLRTDETHYGWVATKMGCNGTMHSAIEQFFHGIKSLQNI